ncbi:MAG TPA: hypothetical protein VN613_08560 [Gemmatimonadaceae bacterium]|nr:hypothetical protein [Gemmatimonadaceae bacterium]
MITHAIDPERALLRHTIATLAYRGGKAMRGAPESFSSFKIGDPPKTPGQILAHIGDLLDWAITLCDGKQAWNNSAPRTWAEDTARFHETLRRLDDRIAGGGDLAESAGALFQGPIADALTHVGQINMLRRLAGVPIKGENYHRADIAMGRVGAEQAEPRREF